MFTIVGLGNPGEKYKDTRHNVGRIVVDAFMRANNFPPMKKSKHARALHAWADIGAERVDVFYPEAYMNESGQTVKHIIDKHEVAPKGIIVVHDDVSLPLGSIRVSFGRGDGGHNGISSIIKSIGTKDFIRIRVGVAQKSFFGGTKRHTGGGLASFVLKTFSGREQKVIEEVSQQVENALKLIFNKGVEQAMQECN